MEALEENDFNIPFAYLMDYDVAKNAERYIELPFVIKQIKLFKAQKGYKPRILDIGCCENRMLLYSAEVLDVDAWGIDLRPYDKDSYEKFIQCDARDIPFEDNSFDITYSISTIEHIGLIHERYDAWEFDEEGDFKVVKEAIRVTKPGGWILLTFPIGEGDSEWYGYSNWIRFYDQKRLNRLFEIFEENNCNYEYQAYVIKDGCWNPSSLEEALKVYSQNTDVIQTNLHLKIEKVS